MSTNVISFRPARKCIDCWHNYQLRNDCPVQPGSENPARCEHYFIGVKRLIYDEKTDEFYEIPVNYNIDDESQL